VKFPTSGAILESSMQKDAPTPLEAGANSADREEETAMELMISGDLFSVATTFPGGWHERVGPFKAQSFQPGPRDPVVAPLGDRLRRDFAHSGDLRGSAEPVDKSAVGVFFHDWHHCKHAYSPNASIPAKRAGKISYMKRTTGERIRDERLARGWTQQELADKIAKIIGGKISRASIAQWEGGGGLRPENVFAAADVMGIEPRWVVFEKGEKSASASPVSAADYAETQTETSANLHQLSEEEIALLRDWRELLPEKRDPHAKAIRRDADEARAYKAMSGDRRGRVVSFDGVDRRIESRMQSMETRRTLTPRFVYEGRGVHSGILGERSIGPSELDETGGDGK
jgi:transcriptional regulator with XRE-family HTH domain